MSRPKLRNRCVLDWLRVVIPYPYDKTKKIKDYLSNNNNPMTAYKVDDKKTASLPFAVINCLGLDGENYTNASLGTIDKLKKKYYGYDTVLIYGHARVFLREPRSYMPLSQINMGVCIELSSHALRDVEQTSAFKNWFTFFRNLVHFFPNAKFSRIDIACDFFKDMRHLSAEGFHNTIKNRHYIFKRAVKSYPTFHGETRHYKDTAETVYLGRRSSALMLRIYNKYQERIQSHGDVWLKNNNIKNWVRWEVQYNNASAPKVAKDIINGVNPALIWHDTIVHLISFQVDKHKINNHIRKRVVKVKWKPMSGNSKKKVELVWVPKWWDNFVDSNHIPQFDFSGKQPHYTYDKHMKWIERDVLSSFVKDLIVQIYQGGDITAYLNHLIRQGMNKLTPKDIDDIVNYSKQIKASKFARADNEFEFDKIIEPIANKLTGMVAARDFDNRNRFKMNQSTTAKIFMMNYHEFKKKLGIRNNYYHMKSVGAI